MTVHLRSSYCRHSAISPSTVLEMYSLFEQYYEHATLDQFMIDLSEKDGAILVYDGGGSVQGFSTVKTLPLDDGKAIGLFSGDTIMSKEHWGNRALKDGFAKFAMQLYFMNPTRPIYWLLISKGYKTYMLLAKNFASYYPRCDAPEDPALAAMVKSYCQTLYPKAYDEERGILDFGGDAQRLRGHVAPIDNDCKRADPAIDFFVSRNPGWHEGHELPCIGEIGLGLLRPYLLKEMRRGKSAKPRQARAFRPAVVMQ